MKTIATIKERDGQKYIELTNEDGDTVDIIPIDEIREGFMGNLNNIAPNWFIMAWDFDKCEVYDKSLKSAPKEKDYLCPRRHAKECACYQRIGPPYGWGCQSAGKLNRKPVYYPASIQEVLDKKAIHLSELNEFQQSRINNLSH
jgi:hypothetical protein